MNGFNHSQSPSIDVAIICIFMLLPLQTALCDNVNDRDSLNQWQQERTFSPGRMFALALIDHYQGAINPKSISRCPFYLSCSNFAAYSVRKYGLCGGVIRFVDRFQFREHPYSSLYYPLAVNGGGIMKLDDRFYCDIEADPPIISPHITSDVSDDPPSRLGWADQLFREGDYERAITVYKEIGYFADDDAIKKRCSYQVARCYLGLGRYQQVAIRISRYLSFDDLTSEQASRATLLMGLTYAMQRLTPLAEMEFHRVLDADNSHLAEIYLAWMAAERGKWRIAQDGFSRAGESFHSDDRTVQQLQRWALRIGQADQIPHKSAWKAGLLSTVIPGSGQMYCGHTVDAVQAFIYVTGFGLATWAAYRYESSFHQPRIGTSISALFTMTYYISNIWGAQRTALYRNHRYREDLLDPIRNSAIQLEFNLPAP